MAQIQIEIVNHSHVFRIPLCV